MSRSGRRRRPRPRGGFTGADTRTGAGRARRRVGRAAGVDRADGNVTDQGTFIIGKDGKVVGSGGGAPGIGGNFNDAPAADGSPIVTITQGIAPAGPGRAGASTTRSAATARLRSSATPCSWSPPARSPR